MKNSCPFRSRNPLSHTKFSVSGSSLKDSDEVYRNGLSSQALPSSRECPLQSSGNQKQKNDSGRFQNPNYGRNSEGDVNEINKDSLFKHKLLSILCDENKNNCRKSHCIVFPDDSLSLVTSLPNFSESDKNRQPMKITKAPNLIAKLMGLEEIPEEALFKSTPHEHGIDNESCYHLKPVIDIQMPKVLNLKSDRATNQKKKKALKEKVDNVRYQGLLRTIPREHSEYLRRVHDRAEIFPPIVIIESLTDSSREGEVEQSLTNLIPRKSKYSPVQKSVSKEMESAGDRALNSVIQKTSSQYHVEQQRIKPAPPKCANARKGLKDEKKLMEEHNQKFYQVMTSQIKKKDKVQSRKGTSEMLVDQTSRIEMDDGNEDLQSRSSAVNPISRGMTQRENERKLNMTQEYTNLTSTMPLSTDAVDQRKGQDEFKCSTRDSLDVCGNFPVKAGAPRQTVGLCRTSANNHFGHSKTTVGLTTDSCRQNLLLSSPLFLGKMEKQFGLIILNPSQPLFSNHVKNDTDGIGTLLSCANELLERKYCEMALVCHPLLQTHLRCK